MRNKKENLVQILIIVMLVDGDIDFEELKIIQEFAENLNFKEEEIRAMVEDMVPYSGEEKKLIRIADELSSYITLPTIKIAGINAINKIINSNEERSENQVEILELLSNKWE